MRLELGKIFIKDIIFDEGESRIEDHILYLNKKELADVSGVADDEHLESIDFDIAHPGESTRITPVKDVNEPRVKVEGGEVFPGILNKVDPVGSGKTIALKDIAVVTTGKIVGFQEGIIDMSGLGAEYTPFSKTVNLVVTIEPVEGVKQHNHEAGVRMAGLRITDFIGRLAKDLEADEWETFETLPILEQVKQYPELPKVVYVYMLQTQGLLHDTYVYGVDAKKIIPTFLYPTEIMDGAICSGNCVSACDKNPTYVHLNNGVIRELYKEHGKSINFLGVVITNENVYLMDKIRHSDMTAKLCEFLGADAAIVSQEGFGNPDTDLIMNCKKIEGKGIQTVIITDEYAGRDGASQSLADADPAANAVVTGGNANQFITLPKMDKVIGHIQFVDTIAGGSDGALKDDGTIEVEIQAITGATNETGFNRLTAKTY
ncbi:beta-aspartyl-peptidase [Finegoldia sp. BIOML-A3]|uniref:glycine/sarcosine/betaine reductase component B subunit n=1 Tax=Finegoldia TaxID=150022 RepID=UPI000B91927A|nr:MULTISPECIES: glycine/sarcosine/betaine reductase component B subunit [Finegoldia]MBS5777146.1 glycine/sarcosine/betaine reductase component B subunit [Finegoldia magna]MCC2717068.1 glycine/sarcosine/betaine reductase component B subunit [Finegoldia magna]MDU2025625.1 glycine/sarcosine/betaine reductase component B subunit [Finegoldia magna]MDU2500924.1 glycine/sarcosine/betaine reductase component B subunit [Finegoldia magna]MDU2575934.1 glycine/sarcosine/betaine reductase component B subu